MLISVRRLGLIGATVTLLTASCAVASPHVTTSPSVTATVTTNQAAPSTVIPPKTLPAISNGITDITGLAATTRQLIESPACLKHGTQSLEVCLAYAYNASLATREMYFVFYKSSKKNLKSAATKRLNSLYRGQARAVVIAEDKLIPRTAHLITPDIKITDVTLNSAATVATLKTTEVWQYLDQTKIAHTIARGSFTVTLEYVGATILYHWIVSSITQVHP